MKETGREKKEERKRGKEKTRFTLFKKRLSFLVQQTNTG